MSEASSRSSGWLSFIVACVIYVIGYWVITGAPPGVAGTFHWWSVIVLFLPWGAVSAVLAKFGRQGRSEAR